MRITIELLKILDLHDNLLAAPTGRKVNGAGAGALVEYLHFGRILGIRVFGLTSTVIWDMIASHIVEL